MEKLPTVMIGEPRILYMRQRKVNTCFIPAIGVIGRGNPVINGMRYMTAWKK